MNVSFSQNKCKMQDINCILLFNEEYYTFTMFVLFSKHWSSKGFECPISIWPIHLHSELVRSTCIILGLYLPLHNKSFRRCRHNTIDVNWRLFEESVWRWTAGVVLIRKQHAHCVVLCSHAFWVGGRCCQLAALQSRHCLSSSLARSADIDIIRTPAAVPIANILCLCSWYTQCNLHRLLSGAAPDQILDALVVFSTDELSTSWRRHGRWHDISCIRRVEIDFWTSDDTDRDEAEVGVVGWCQPLYSMPHDNCNSNCHTTWTCWR